MYLHGEEGEKGDWFQKVFKGVHVLKKRIFQKGGSQGCKVCLKGVKGRVQVGSKWWFTSDFERGQAGVAVFVCGDGEWRRARDFFSRYGDRRPPWAGGFQRKNIV